MGIFIIRFLIIPHSRAPANGGMGGGRSNGVSAGAQAQIEDLTTQVLPCFAILLRMLVATICLVRSCAQVLAEVKAKKQACPKLA